MTSANNVGFLSKLNVLTVLPFAYFMLKEKISKKVFIAVMVMLFGTFLLSTNLSFAKINVGDLILCNATVAEPGGVPKCMETDYSTSGC